MAEHGHAQRAVEGLVAEQELLVDGLDLVAVGLVVGELEAGGDRAPFALVGDAVVAAEFLDGFEEAVEVDVFVADRGALVEGRARVVHEFVELRDEVVFFFEGFFVRALELELEWVCGREGANEAMETMEICN